MKSFLDSDEHECWTKKMIFDEEILNFQPFYVIASRRLKKISNLPRAIFVTPWINPRNGKFMIFLSLSRLFLLFRCSIVVEMKILKKQRLLNNIE